MPNYAIPPWIGGGADPAQHFSVGMQMGVRLGAEQAAQQFQQQQMLRQQQQDEFERQYKNTVLQMQVDQATRKQQAISSYQQMIQGGVNPIDALRQVGPSMGVDPTHIEQIEETRKMREAQTQALSAYRTAELAQGEKRLALEEKRLNRQPGSLGEKLATSEKLDAEVQSAADSGDKAALEDAIAKRDRQEALIYPKGTRLSGVNPMTGKRETRIVGGTTAEEDQLMAGTKSKLQQELQGSVQAAKVLHDMENMVSGGTVGFFPYLYEKLGRKGVLGMTGLASGAEAAGPRTALRGAKLDLLRELETKGHASATVLKAVEETLPSLGAFETPGAAKEALRERKRSIIAQGLNQAKDLGVSSPQDLIEMLSTFPDTEIKRMMDQRLIPAEAAQEAYKLQVRRHSNTPVASWLTNRAAAK